VPFPRVAVGIEVTLGGRALIITLYQRSGGPYRQQSRLLTAAGEKAWDGFLPTGGSLSSLIRHSVISAPRLDLGAVLLAVNFYVAEAAILRGV